MTTYRYRKVATAWIVGISICALGGAGNCPGPVRVPADESVLETFDELEAHVRQLPGAALDKKTRAGLTQKLEESEQAYREGEACPATYLLGSYLEHTLGLMKGDVESVAVAEDLRNRGWMLRHHLLTSLPERMSCQGFKEVGAAPNLEIAESDNKHVSGDVSFGQPLLGSVKAGGETWTQLEVPSLQSRVGEPGKPAVPTWHALVAVPMDAQVRLVRAVPETSSAIPMNLFPFQDQPIDIEQNPDGVALVDAPFFKDEKAYQEDSFQPAEPCVVELLGQARDLQIAQLTCAGGQYNPASRTYRPFDGVEFAIAFEGGSGHFITSQSLSPFERASRNAMQEVINRAVVDHHVEVVDVLDRRCLGEELLILTHPDFIDAAEDLADWKQEKGITTTVREVGTGTPYETGDEIDALIEDRYERCAVRPSYVLLLGDAEFIPPARQDFVTNSGSDEWEDETTGSDYGYAMYPQHPFDILPDFAVGRISVDVADEDVAGNAQEVVDKIIRYESDPPFVGFGAGAPFYTTAAHAGNFECCRMYTDGTPLNDQPGTDQRTFIEVLETARDLLLDHGYEVERLYTVTVDEGGYCVDDEDPCTEQVAYSGDTTPVRYYNGTLLPEDLRSESGFRWNGSGFINNAFNEGRFLIAYRGHGWSGGLSNPEYPSWRVSGASNGELLPVLYVINCLTGYFDQETDIASDDDSFMELALRASHGGMVGGIGANRVTTTWANTALTRGFYDATWPTLAPEFGESESIRRLGDILNHGKMYLLTQVGVAQTAGSVSIEAALDDLVIFHAFGDPTLEMWTSNPHQMVLMAETSFDVGPDRLRVFYPHERAMITAFQDTPEGTVPVGRAVVKKGVAEIPYFHPPVPGSPIRLSASFENAVSVLLKPDPSQSGGIAD